MEPRWHPQAPSSLPIIFDHASLSGPPGFQDSSWCSLSSSPITQEGVAVWPCSVNILLEFTPFEASLHWPQGDADLGNAPPCCFLLFHLPAVDAQSSKVGSLFPATFRSLGHLLGGLTHLIPCEPGAQSTRHMHLGWEQSGHGLSSLTLRPLLTLHPNPSPPSSSLPPSSHSSLPHHHHQHPLRGPYIWVVWNFLDHFKSKPNWLCYC